MYEEKKKRRNYEMEIKAQTDQHGSKKNKMKGRKTERIRVKEAFSKPCRPLPNLLYLTENRTQKKLSA